MSRRALLLVLTLLSACAPTKTLKPAMAVDLPSNINQPFYVQVAPGSERLISAEHVLDGSAMVQNGLGTSSTLNMATQNAANSAPAGNGAGVAAGMMLSSMILAQANQSAAQTRAKAEAEERVAPLRAVLAGQNLDGWYSKAFEEAFANAGRPSTSAAALMLNIAPQALLSQDMQSVRVISEVQLMLGRTLLYQGRIEVHSAPLNCDECLTEWTTEQAKPYQAAVAAGVQETVRVLLLDWQTQHFASTSNPERTLRYQLGDNRYVERGRLVDSQPDRSLYLSLRGWVKSVPVAIEP